VRTEGSVISKQAGTGGSALSVRIELYEQTIGTKPRRCGGLDLYFNDRRLLLILGSRIKVLRLRLFDRKREELISYSFPSGRQCRYLLPKN